METRQLGGSGFKVPILSLGTGTFGGTTQLFKAWGAAGAAEATRMVDIALEAGLNMFDSADMYSKGDSEVVLGQAIKGRRNQVILSTKGTFRVGPGANDVGSSRYHLLETIETSLASSRNRLHRSVSTARVRRADARRGIARHAQHAGPSRQDSLHRLLEFFGLAPDEIAGRE